MSRPAEIGSMMIGRRLSASREAKRDDQVGEEKLRRDAKGERTMGEVAMSAGVEKFSS